MRELIKCHFNYLISKTTLIITLLVCVVMLLGNISSIFALDDKFNYIHNNFLYFVNSFTITKIIIIIYTVFLYGYSFLNKSDQYVFILIASGVGRIKVVFSKIIAISLIVVFINYIAYFQYNFIGFLSYNYFYFNKQFLIVYIELFFLSLFFGLFSMLLIQIYNNIYIIIIPFSLMNLSEIINDGNNLFIKLFNLFIPYLKINYGFYYSYLHLLILILLFLIFNIYIYTTKDFL